MDQPSLESTLADLNLPALRYFDVIDSTNAEAWRWLDAGAPGGSVVVADEQTAGRGRSARRWITPRGAALAFSLLLQMPLLEAQHLHRLTGLGALSVRTALEKLFGLQAEIKWPNDVLIDGRKAAGVLVETRWYGQVISAAVIGIGINIAPASIRSLQDYPGGLNFPAACIEDALSRPVDRLELLQAVLRELLYTWLPRLPESGFITAWEDCLAFRGQWVELYQDLSTGSSRQDEAEPAHKITGKVLGLTQEGGLKLLTGEGTLVAVSAGEIHLRPIDRITRAQLVE